MTEHGLLEQRIGEWRAYFLKRQAVRASDVDELEDHLRSQVDALTEAGLDEDEAFLVAVKRLGDLDAVSREFANEYSERLWKQLVVTPAGPAADPSSRRDATVAVGLGALSAVLLKLPELFGVHMTGPYAHESFYVHNISFFVLPVLSAFFVWKRGMDPRKLAGVVVPFLAGILIINLMPFKSGGHTEILAVIHLPIALWLTVGFAYVAGEWRNHERRMNFVRFSGEWFIYYTLIALGGGVLMMFTVFVFEAIGIKAESFIQSWLVPCGAAGAVVIAAWLVESKQSVIENMAPVLTLLFTPLFTLLLLTFVVTMIWTGSAIDVGREVLIGFDLLLVLVLGLLLYAISARDSQSPPNAMDKLRLLLVLSALLVDIIALWAIAARISEFGFSPNKTAALGLNILLLVNLGRSAWLYTGFLRNRASFTQLERWQTAYLPVFGLWAWIVVSLFPGIFGYQ